MLWEARRRGRCIAWAADGGAALPVAICQGQAAPAHGVFLTVDRAAVLAGELARGREVEQALQDQPVPAPPSAMVVVAAAVGGLVLGAIATAWIVHEVK